jgi:hypothetical protein
MIEVSAPVFVMIICIAGIMLFVLGMRIGRRR